MKCSEYFLGMDWFLCVLILADQFRIKATVLDTQNLLMHFNLCSVFQLQAITQIRNEIIKSLSLYYYTFVDLLDFKDNVCELLTTMDACQVHLDIVSFCRLAFVSPLYCYLCM